MATKIELGNGNWGVKPNGVLAYNDEDNVFKAIELQSSRASGATYVGEDGLIKDAEVGVPRIDWTNGVGELLLEPQSTNLWTDSEGSTTMTTPQGDFGVFTLNTSSISSSHISLASLDVSMYFLVKKSGGGVPTITNSSGSGDIVVYVGGLSGEGVNGTLTSIGNDWYLYEYTGNQAGFVTNTVIQNRSGVDVYVTKIQLEQLSYPTSYIRTSGSQVTRIADAVTGNSSLGQVINSSEGVLYAEINKSNITLDSIIALSDGTNSNRILFNAKSNGAIQFYLENSLGSQVNYTSSEFSLSTNIKIAFKFKENDCSFWVNGNELSTDLVCTMPSSIDLLEFKNPTGSSPFYGRIRDLRVYDTALTDAELTALTTL